MPLPEPPYPLGGLLRARHFGPTLEAIPHLLTIVCSGLQTVSDGLANKGHFRLTFRANRPASELILTANEPTFIANSLQTAR